MIYALYSARVERKLQSFPNLTPRLWGDIGRTLSIELTISGAGFECQIVVPVARLTLRA